mgnify:CR=1 FL=1
MLGAKLLTIFQFYRRLTENIPSEIGSAVGSFQFYRRLTLLANGNPGNGATGFQFYRRLTKVDDSTYPLDIRTLSIL